MEDGQFNVYLYAAYDYYREVLGLTQETKPLVAFMELAQTISWFWPFKNTAVLCERPQTIQLDAQGRLHCENGKAFEYRDGWGHYYWHGLSVPERLILHPETATVQEIQDERNAEIRRVMLERYEFRRCVRLVFPEQ